jgi:hypothetical protein
MTQEAKVGMMKINRKEDNNATGPLQAGVFITGRILGLVPRRESAPTWVRWACEQTLSKTVNQ